MTNYFLYVLIITIVHGGWMIAHSTENDVTKQGSGAQQQIRVKRQWKQEIKRRLGNSRRAPPPVYIFGPPLRPKNGNRRTKINYRPKSPAPPQWHMTHGQLASLFKDQIARFDRQAEQRREQAKRRKQQSVFDNYHAANRHRTMLRMQKVRARLKANRPPGAPQNPTNKWPYWKNKFKYRGVCTYALKIQAIC